MQLNLTSTRKPRETDRTVERRSKLVQRIDQQLSKLRDTADFQVDRGTWYWQADDGSYLLSIKYGRQDLELSKGMFSIQCDDWSAVEATLSAVRDMVLSGELDDALAKASAALRAKFEKQK